MEANPRRKEDFSFFVFSGKASRNLIEFINILSNNEDRKKPDAVNRSSGYLVNNCFKASDISHPKKIKPRRYVGVLAEVISEVIFSTCCR
jgi:hypothetical protein